MSVVVTHTTPADATFSPTGQAAWDAAHALAGAVDLSQGGTNNTATPGAGQIIFSDGTKLTSDANLTWDATNGLLVKKNISCPVTTGGGSSNQKFGASSSIGSAIALCCAFGDTASVTASSSLAVGAFSTASAANTIALGSSATASADGAIAIGENASALSVKSIAIGKAAFLSSGKTSIHSVGSGHSITHDRNTLLGSFIRSRVATELCFGHGDIFPLAPGFRLIGCLDSLDGFSDPVTRDTFRIGTAWTNTVDTTRTSQAICYVYDTAEREFMRADSTGSAPVNVAFLSGGSLITQGAALGTTATDGFLYIPTSAGAPTGAPTAQTGTVATEYDTTNDALQVYNGAWKTCPTQDIGSWTPADNSGAALSFTGVSANYTKIGNMVFAYATWTYPVTASGANASISGLPFASANANYAQVPSVVDTSASITGGLVAVPVKNTTTLNFDVGTPFGPATNLQLSTASVAVMLIYPVA